MSLEECPRTLSLAPKAVTRLAGQSALVEDAQIMLDRSTSWTKKNTHRRGIDIFSACFDDRDKTVTWFSRTTKHKREDVSYDVLQQWVNMGERSRLTHGAEKRPATRVQEANQLRYISDSESVWSTLHMYPSPVSPRIFTDHVVTYSSDFPSNRRTELIISTPVNLGEVEGSIEVEGRGKRARHVRIEQIQELDDEFVEWKVLLCEDIGGTFARWCRRKRTRLMLTREYHAFMASLKSQQNETRGRVTVKGA